MKKRVRHVVTEIERVRSFVRAFAQGDIKAAGLCSTLPTIRWPPTTRSLCPSWTSPWTWPARTVPTVRV